MLDCIAVKTSTICRAMALNVERARWAGLAPRAMQVSVPVAASSPCGAPRAAMAGTKTKPALSGAVCARSDRAAAPHQTQKLRQNRPIQTKNCRQIGTEL